MANGNENFEEFSLLHRTSLRIPKDRFKIKEINYEDEDGFFIVNIDYHDLFEVFKTEHDLSFNQLLGRALARTRADKEQKNIWTFLSFQDFEKTGTKPERSFVYQISQNIKNIIPDQLFATTLWQDQKDVWAMILTENSNEEANEKISSFLQVEIKNDYLVSGPYKNFTEAEIKIQKALREAA